MPIQIETFHAPGRFHDPIVGIDLGTTHSLVAIVKDGKPEVLHSREGKRLIPSVVALIDGKIETGFAAKRQKMRDPERTIFSVKRLLGRDFQDLQATSETLPYSLASEKGAARILIGDRAYTAIEISAMILRELRLSAEAALGVKVSRAVITVPAYFNDSQRQATRAAGRLAGLDVLRMINEPTAASLAYGLDRKKQGLIAVYDLGGGTFDISILKLKDGIFEVLSTHGDTSLGGDDLDQAIATVAIADILDRFGLEVAADPFLHAQVLEAAEQLKISFSTQPEATFEVQVRDETYRRVWRREEFEKQVTPVLERTRDSCLKALKDAGIELAQLSDVVLVGGPTRLAVVQRFVEELFGRTPNSSLNPDEVVAEGAAIQADILSGNNREILLLDVVPLSLGLETYGGLMSPLILRNTKIPTVAREVFTTFADQQTGVDIHVLQGERDKVEDNRSLARFKLKGIQAMPAGMARIEVSFLIDADGILQVAAKDLRTGHEQSIEVRPTYGLTDEEVEQMLLSGIENAESDQSLRQLVEAKNKAEPVLRAVEKQLPLAQRFLPENDLRVINEALVGLRTSLAQSNVQKIQDATAFLNQSTIRLAEVLVRETLSASIQKPAK